MNEKPRDRHPDLFTDEEAAQYLGLTSGRSMETVSHRFGVNAVDLPGPRQWHRDDLEAVIEKARAAGPGRPERGRQNGRKLTINRG